MHRTVRPLCYHTGTDATQPKATLTARVDKEQSLSDDLKSNAMDAGPGGEAREPVDWSTLREDYERIGNLTRLARYYRVGYYKVRDELVRQGIPIKPWGHVKGQKKSQAWREASAKRWNDPIWREEQRQKWLDRLPSMNGPAANSPLERLLRRSLRKAGISFSTQRRMLDRYVVDILITQNPVIVEVDGNTHLRTKSRDAERDANLRESGYQVFRFTGKPICNDPDGCIRDVIEATGLLADAETSVRYPERNVWLGQPIMARWQVLVDL